MDYRFLRVDVSAATFEGLSLSYQRKIALVATVGIWLGMGYACYIAALRLEGLHIAEDVVDAFLFGILIHYILCGQFFLLTASKALLYATPLGVLYRQDREILDKMKEELLKITSEVQLRDYLDYGKINPVIRARGSLVVMAHQSKGDLKPWIGNARNLKLLANLVY
ncbi:hypothetical protein ACJJI4_23795 (plasmid) [Microbulbifer sp. TRSA002]|uniref:hypothetical protein n=1 Tax=Microbulbifer sp. TRSA002 TaxID=3243382 RepID=UPI00403A56D1